MSWDFQLKGQNIVLLKREVEILQTVERVEEHHERTPLPDGGYNVETTHTCTYEEMWTTELIDSTRFKDPSRQDDNTCSKGIETRKFPD